MITVLGAGVLGLCVAAEARARRLPVQIVDPAGGPGQQACSWWAGGMLAPWCEAETAPPPVLHHGQRAADWWAAHTNVTRNGTLVITPARDRAEIARFARRTSGHQGLNGAEITALEPALQGRFDTALFMPDEAHLDPRNALADLAAPSRIITDMPDRPGQIIDCRGWAARDMLPLRGVRGEMAILHCPDITLARPVRLLHPRVPAYLVPRAEGVFMLGATMIESSAAGPISVRSTLELLSTAFALHPAFGEARVLQTGTGIRPAFPDNLPRIGRAGDRIWANGLFRHGYLLAPAVAQQVLDHIETDQKPEFWHEDHL